MYTRRKTRFSPFFLMRNNIPRRRQRRSGSILTLVAICLVVLLGFCGLAVDYGMMVTTKTRLQRTCDASALAGAAELPTTNSGAMASAITYAQLAATENGVTTAEILVEFPTTNQIRVTATRQVSLLFMRVLGISTGTVKTTALAGRTNLSGAAIGPLAITVQDYNLYGKGNSTFGVDGNTVSNMPFQGDNFGESLTLNLIRNTQENFVPGTVTALDLRPGNSGASPAQFQDDVENGYNGAPVSINADADALRANENAQGPALADGVADRFARAAAAPWNIPASSTTYPTTSGFTPTSDNPRVMMILIGNPNPADNNQPQIYGRGLVPVWLESVTESHNDGAVIKIRLLQQYTYNNADPNNILGDGSTPDTGVSVIRLLS